MNHRARLFITCFLLFLGHYLLGQEYPISRLDIQTFAEEIFAVQDLDINYDDLYESLLQLYQNPINLNDATREDLSSLYVLSPHQISDFFTYINQNGKLLSIYELQAIPSFNLPTIYKLIPFVTVQEVPFSQDSRSLWQRIREEENNYLVIRYQRTLEERKGFTDPDTTISIDPDLGDTITSLSPRYLGSPDKIYARFRVSHPGDFSLGFTLEKDAGEEVIWDSHTSRYLADYYSFHFMLENKGIVKKLALGDYQVQVGQGLLLGAGFNVGKGSETITTIRRSNLGIRPYTSVLESGFFRGIATTLGFQQWETTLFYSDKDLDATVQTDTLSAFEEFISSLQNSGLHRTPRELAAKNVIGHRFWGSNVIFKSRKGNFQVGLTYTHSNFELPIIRRPAIYNQFEFSGTQNYNLGMHYNFNWENFNFFGEAARSKSGGLGAVSGFIASLSPTVDMAMHIRNYDRDFHSLFGAGFGEGSRNINEQGIYWGMKFTPIPELFITAYYDRFRFKWLRFRSDGPSQGYEYLTRVNYKPTREVLLYAQFRQEGKETNSVDPENNLNVLELGIKRNYIINIDYKVHPQIKMKSRVQFSTYSLAEEFTKGFAIIQDLNIELHKFKIGGRIALFDTEDFENRQYVYERDVLFAYSFPAYNGVGLRSYMIAQYSPNSTITFWVRYTQTNFKDRDTIGSGLEEIKGDELSEIKAQVRFRF